MLWEWMDVFKKFCKLSMKRVTSVQYVIIALILHNHPGTEGAPALYMQGSKGVLQHQTCRKKEEKRFPLHSSSRWASVLIPSGARYETDVIFVFCVNWVNYRYWVNYKSLEAGTRRQDTFAPPDCYSHWATKSCLCIFSHSGPVSSFWQCSTAVIWPVESAPSHTEEI